MKEGLNKIEKEYLEERLGPFKDEIIYIQKIKTDWDVYIFIYKAKDAFTIPMLDNDIRWKNLKLGKAYTLEELGLFEGE